MCLELAKMPANVKRAVTKLIEIKTNDVFDVSKSPRAARTVKVPHRLGGLREVVREETAAVVAVKGAGEAPLIARERSQVAKLDHQEIAGLGRDAVGVSHLEGAAEVVHLGEVDKFDVIGRVIVLDLAARPVKALDADEVAGLNRRDCGDVWVPTIVERCGLLPGGLGGVDGDDGDGSTGRHCDWRGKVWRLKGG
jgi:hypothetical protein